MQPVGFEPTHPKILRPERSALDHSAKTATFYIFIYIYIINKNKIKNKNFLW